MNMEHLFSPYQLNKLNLTNRMVMAPMTRSRALENIPNDLMAAYYAQRATAGLIISEGTSPSPNGLGYPRIPGIFSEDQILGWKKVTSAVHEKGGKIILQLMHTGRVSHPLNLPEGAILVAPSSVKLEKGTMWVDGEGLKEIPAPKEMSNKEVKQAIGEYIHAAENAIKAGFDGIELHAANGYLINQFLNPHLNKRTDEYGGNIENRSRFLMEITQGTIEAIGKEKIGVRVSPYGEFNETPHYNEENDTYHYIGEKLNELQIGYLHITDQSLKGEPQDLAISLRKIFKNTLILSGGFNAESAENALKNNHADLISFARPFIPNPDLVERYKNNLPLNQPNFDLFYAPGPEGYVDYPAFEEVKVF